MSVRHGVGHHRFRAAGILLLLLLLVLGFFLVNLVHQLRVAERAPLTMVA